MMHVINSSCSRPCLAWAKVRRRVSFIVIFLCLHAELHKLEVSLDAAGHWEKLCSYADMRT